MGTFICCRKPPVVILDITKDSGKDEKNKSNFPHDSVRERKKKLTEEEYYKSEQLKIIEQQSKEDLQVNQLFDDIVGHTVKDTVYDNNNNDNDNI